MREDGVVRKQTAGDEVVSNELQSHARLVLGRMKNTMQLGGLSQLSKRVELADGTEIFVQSVFGQDTIQIKPPLVRDTLPPEKKTETTEDLKLILPAEIWYVASVPIQSGAAYYMTTDAISAFPDGYSTEIEDKYLSFATTLSPPQKVLKPIDTIADKKTWFRIAMKDPGYYDHGPYIRLDKFYEHSVIITKIAGADAALFMLGIGPNAINPDTGVKLKIPRIEFIGNPDCQAPADANRDNDYEILIWGTRVNSAGETQKVSQKITVKARYFYLNSLLYPANISIRGTYTGGGLISPWPDTTYAMGVLTYAADFVDAVNFAKTRSWTEAQAQANFLVAATVYFTFIGDPMLSYSKTSDTGDLVVYSTVIAHGAGGYRASREVSYLALSAHSTYNSSYMLYEVTTTAEARVQFQLMDNAFYGGKYDVSVRGQPVAYTYVSASPVWPLVSINNMNLVTGALYV